MAAVAILLAAGARAAPATAADHPTLPQMWYATVREFEVGVV